MPGPTPQQRAILELLTEFAYLTTGQIWEYLPTPAGTQARRNVLARLQQRGWIAAAPLYPERGAASERYWTLTPAGAAVLGIPFTPPDTTDLAAIRRSIGSYAAASLVGVGPNQTRILRLLAEWKQLTTTQMWRHLAPDKPHPYVKKWLWNLERRGLVRGVAWQPERGGAGEYYWMLLEAGAQVLGIPYHQQYHRRPNAATLQHRGLLLDLLRAGEQAGWQMLPPATTAAAVRQVEQQLIAAVLARGGQAFVEPGRVGAIVPERIPDWVAYVPGQPARTAILVPHPPYATRSFWSHKREMPGSTVQRRPARLDLYARLAPLVPVIGVFSSTTVGYAYAPLLRQAGFGWASIEDVAEILTRHAAE